MSKLQLAKHITLTGDGRLLIDGEEFGYYLAEEDITARVGRHVTKVTVTILAEGFDYEPKRDA